MSLRILFWDELRGFYKSSVMIVLWIGLPVVSMLAYMFLPDTGQEIPFSLLTASVLSSLGGSLASIMLAVYIIHDKSRGVYPLYLIRPVRSGHLVLAKFLAVFLCVAAACALALLSGFVLDFLYRGELAAQTFRQTVVAFAQSLAVIAMACALGVFVGVSVSSVLVGVILVIFVGNNATSVVLLLPTMLQWPHPLAVTLALAALVSLAFLGAGLWIFERRQA